MYLIFRCDCGRVLYAKKGVATRKCTCGKTIKVKSRRILQRVETAQDASYAVQTSNGGLRFTVTGLSSGTNYHLELTTKDTSSKTIATYNANFKTLGDNDEGIEEIQSDQSRKGTKILLNGHIYILRGDKIYTIQGQEVRYSNFSQS